MKIPVLDLLVIGLVVNFSHAAHAVTAVSSSLQMSVGARASTEGPFASDTDLTSQGALLNPLTVSVSATSASGGATVTTSGSAAANFLDASQGTVTFTRLGWSTQNAPDISLSDFGAGPNWLYTFAITDDALFELSWNSAVAASDAFGLQGFAFYGIGGSQILGPNDSGFLTRRIPAGTYVFGLQNTSNIQGPLLTRDAFVSGAFNWRIFESTPEPGTLALLGLGLAGLGLTRRRTKH